MASLGCGIIGEHYVHEVIWPSPGRVPHIKVSVWSPCFQRWQPGVWWLLGMECLHHKNVCLASPPPFLLEKVCSNSRSLFWWPPFCHWTYQRQAIPCSFFSWLSCLSGELFLLALFSWAHPRTGNPKLGPNHKHHPKITNCNLLPECVWFSFLPDLQGRAELTHGSILLLINLGRGTTLSGAVQRG